MSNLAYFQTLIGKRYISFHSTCILGRGCTKYFWEVGGSLFRAMDKKFTVQLVLLEYISIAKL